MDVATLGLRIQTIGGKEAESQIKSLASTGADASRTLVAAGKAFTAAWITREFVKAISDAQYSFAQLEAAVKSTAGVAGYSAEQLRKHAEALQETSIYGHEAVESAQALLLTFTNIGHDALPRATQAVVDIAARMGGDLKGAALQVGKALQDPSVGLSMLRRSGIMFTDSQQEVIQRLYDTGKAAEAQAMVLDLLEQKVGGAAVAARDTLGGALEHLKNTFGDMLEVSKDGTSGLVGAINALADALANAREKADGFWAAFQKERNAELDAIQPIKDWIKGALDRLDYYGSSFANWGKKYAGITTRLQGPSLGTYVAGATEDPFAAQAIRRDQQIADAARAKATADKEAAEAAKKAAEAEKALTDAQAARVEALKAAVEMGTLSNADLKAAAELEAVLLARSQDTTLSLTERNLATQQLIDVTTALHAKENAAAQAAREHAAAMSAVTEQTKKAAQSMQDYINAGQGKTVGAEQTAKAREELGLGKKTEGPDYTRLVISALLPIFQQGMAKVFGTSQLGSAMSGGLSGAASGFMTAGPWGALIGGVSGAVSSLLGFSDSAEKAAEAMRKARAEFVASMQEQIDRSKMDDAQKAMADLAKKMGDSMKGWGDKFGGASGYMPGNFTTIEQIQQYVASLKEWSGALGGEAGAAWKLMMELFDSWIKQAQEDAEAAKKAAEEAAAAKEKQRQADQKALDDDIRVRALVVAGKNDEAEIERLKIQQAAELADAQAKGLDTTKLAALQADELAAALKKQAEAAEAARLAAERLAQSFKDELNIGNLQLGGDQNALALANFDIQQRKDLERWQDALRAGTITQDLLDQFIELQKKQREKFMADMAAATAGGSAADVPGPTERAVFQAGVAAESVASVRAMTETQAIRALDLDNSRNVILRQIELNTRPRGGDGAGLSYGYAARPGLTVIVQGDIVGTTPRELSDELTRRLNEGLARAAAQENRAAGSAVRQ